MFGGSWRGRGGAAGGSRGGRGNGKKKNVPPGDLIALGQNASRPAHDERGNKGTSETHRHGISQQVEKMDEAMQGQHSQNVRKREVASSSGSSANVQQELTKKLKMSSDTSESDTSRGEEEWESVAVKVLPRDFLHALNLSKDRKCIEAMICGAIKKLKEQPGKPDNPLCTALSSAAETNPHYFRTDFVTAALCSLLGQLQVNKDIKLKANATLASMTVGVIMTAFAMREKWPLQFVEEYAKDAAGARNWVDQEDCKPFVDNICTSFKTLPLAKESGSQMTADVDVIDLTVSSKDTERSQQEKICTTKMRYAGRQEEVQKIVLDIVKSRMPTRQQSIEGTSKNILCLLISACELPEVRLFSMQNMEVWLQTQRLAHSARDLLRAICVNIDISRYNQSDGEVIGLLSKIKLMKARPLFQFYLECVKEAVSKNLSNNMDAFIKHIICNELSDPKNPCNMTILGAIFNSRPDLASSRLGDVFLEFLMQKEDQVTALRILLRAIVRSLKSAINLCNFCSNLMSTEKTTSPQFQSFEQKQRVFLAIGNLIVSALFLLVSSKVKQAATFAVKGDEQELEILHMQVSNIQLEAVTWLHQNALAYHPDVQEFNHNLSKLLLLEPPEMYGSKKDPWPSESEKLFLLKLISEAPVLQDTLVALFKMGLSKDHLLTAGQAMEFGFQLVIRAAAINREGLEVLPVKDTEIIDMIFNLSCYHHPETVDLPEDYDVPVLGIQNLYWKSWIMLLILAAHNPTPIGWEAWNHYPMLRTFIEMIVTDNFTYPCSTLWSREIAENMKSKERQLVELEKSQILIFEGYLASTSSDIVITESTSHLVSLLMTYNPQGPPRIPPSNVLDQLKSLSKSLRLRALLSTVQDPGYVSEIIYDLKTYGLLTGWVKDLVHAHVGPISNLPVMCLCEYITNVEVQQIAESRYENVEGFSNPDGRGNVIAEKVKSELKKQAKLQEIRAHLQGILDSKSSHSSGVVLDCFLESLASVSRSTRIRAVNGLQWLLTSHGCAEKDDQDVTLDAENITIYDVEGFGHKPHQHINQQENPYAWLLTDIPLLVSFNDISGRVTAGLQNACLVSCEPDFVSACILFFARYSIHISNQYLFGVTLDLAWMMMGHPIVTRAILPQKGCIEPETVDTFHALLEIFTHYSRKVRDTVVTHSQKANIVCIEWENGVELTTDITVVWTIALLLSYGPIGDPRYFTSLLEMWFPPGQEGPKGYALGTNNEVILFSEDIKLKMMCSNVKNLVDASMTGLTLEDLVKLVQKFGISCLAVTQLLQMLDEASQANPALVIEKVAGKGAGIIRMVEAHRGRGATGGEKFLGLLQPRDVLACSPEKMMPAYTEVQGVTINTPTEKVDPSPCQVKAMMEIVFWSDSNSARTKAFRDLQTKLRMEAASIATRREHEKKERLILCASLKALEDAMNKEGFALRAASMPAFTGALIRLLVTLCNDPTLENSGERTHLQELGRRLLLLPEMNLCPSKSSLLKFCGLPKKKSSAPLKIETSSNMIEALRNSPPDKLEKVIRKLVKEMVTSNQRRQLVEVLWAQVEDINSHLSPEMFLDWLLILDPEMNNGNSALYMNVLFSRRDISIRPALISHLLYGTQWKTLNSYIIRLLQEYDAQYNPTPLLDILSTLTTSHSYLWQGRDLRYNPRSQAQEDDTLRLDATQLISLTEYIVEETSQALAGANDDTPLRMLEARTNLVIQSCRHRMELLEGGILSKLQALVHGGSEAAMYLMTRLYLHVPRINNLIASVDAAVLGTCDVSTSCTFDAMLRTLISYLGCPRQGMKWVTDSTDAEMLVRKAAAHHPVLFLRFLPLLARFLHGRSWLNYWHFRSQNNQVLFSRTIGILELLQPQLFWAQHAGALEDILSTYMKVYRQHTCMTDLGPILGRVVALMRKYIQYSPSRGLAFAQKHACLLSELSKVYFHMGSLHVLTSAAERSNQNPEILATSTTLALLYNDTTECVRENLWPLYQQLAQKKDPIDILMILQELERHSSVDFNSALGPAANSLKELISHSAEEVRSLAFILLVRYMKSCPREAAQFMGEYMGCLDSNNMGVVVTAMQHLSPFVILVQEHAEVLLKKVFELAIAGKFDSRLAVKAIAESLNRLSIQNYFGDAEKDTTSTVT